MGAVKFDMSCSLGAVKVDDPSGTCHSPTDSVGWLVGCHQLVLGTGRSFLQRHHVHCRTVRKKSAFLCPDCGAFYRTFSVAVSLNPVLRIPYSFQFYSLINAWSLLGEFTAELPGLWLKAGL